MKNKKKKRNKNIKFKKAEPFSFLFFKKHLNFLPLTTLAVLLIILFYKVVFFDKTTLSPDTLSNLSYSSFHTATHYAGKIALWNPWIFSGMPSFAAFGDMPNLVPCILIYFMDEGRLLGVNVTMEDFLSVYGFFKYIDVLLPVPLALFLWGTEKNDNQEESLEYEEEYNLSKKMENIFNYIIIIIIFSISVIIVMDLPGIKKERSKEYYSAFTAPVHEESISFDYFYEIDEKGKSVIYKYTTKRVGVTNNDLIWEVKKEFDSFVSINNYIGE